MTARFDRAFFFLLDGARVDVFAELMQKGELPNIARYMAEPGAHQTAISVFPSVTGVAYVPYLTGLFPGRANLPGYRWFDRERYQHKRPLSMMRFRNYSGLGSYMMNRDLSKDATTLFELLRPSSNIFSGISRGTGFYRNAAFFRRIPAAIKLVPHGRLGITIDAAGERFLTSRGPTPPRALHVSHHVLDRRVFASPRPFLGPRTRALPRLRSASLVVSSRRLKHHRSSSIAPYS